MTLDGYAIETKAEIQVLGVGDVTEGLRVGTVQCMVRGKPTSQKN